MYICSNRIDLFSLCSRSLQQKKPVTAETFESVTVYFSDIHDFSTLTAESTPLEVQFVIQISEVMVISWKCSTFAGGQLVELSLQDVWRSNRSVRRLQGLVTRTEYICFYNNRSIFFEQGKLSNPSKLLIASLFLFLCSPGNKIVSVGNKGAVVIRPSAEGWDNQRLIHGGIGTPSQKRRQTRRRDCHHGLGPPIRISQFRHTSQTTRETSGMSWISCKAKYLSVPHFNIYQVRATFNNFWCCIIWSVVNWSARQ